MYQIKARQKKAIEQFYGKKDPLVVLPTAYGKSLIYQLLVLLAKRASNNTSLKIISEQIIEDIEVGKFDVVCTRSSAESATDKRFLQSLKKRNTT